MLTIRSRFVDNSISYWVILKAIIYETIAVVGGYCFVAETRKQTIDTGMLKFKPIQNLKTVQKN